MNFSDTHEEAIFRAELTRWLTDNRHSAPKLSPQPDETQIQAWRAWSRQLYEAGYVGLTWPKSVGGHGMPPSYLAIWLEESARSGVPDHLGIIGLGMAGPTIIEWGTEQQKDRFLKPILHCDEIWCQGFSEPDAGSDLAAVRTQAVLDEGSWVVTGQKVWSSFAHFADWCLLLARTDFDAPAHSGLSYFLVDMQSPGIEVRPLRQITGDPEFNEIFFNEVRVPAKAMLGAPGEGWRVAISTLSYERGTHGVSLAARLDADIRAAVALLTRVQSGGRPIIDDPLVQDQLTVLWVELQALKATNLRVLSSLSREGRPGPDSTIAKLKWSELNQQLTRLVAEALGLAGIEDGPRAVDSGKWSYNLLRSRGNTIEGGTSEVLRNIIAERVLGLPRSR